jgi:metal-sulfur cluster biosynthetic enzyme
VQVLTSLSPAWTTDWMTDEGKRKLEAYGIAPPPPPPPPPGPLSRTWAFWLGPSVWDRGFSEPPAGPARDCGRHATQAPMTAAE